MSRGGDLRARLLARLGAAGVTRFAILVALVLAAPSLFYGLVMDDRLQRQAAIGQSKLYHHGPLDLFEFVSGNKVETLHLLDLGFGAWWSDTHARIAFLRPVSSALMWFDYKVVIQPIAIHAHSILWYAAALAIAAALYRRFSTSPECAGLAMLMFAIDPTHGLIAGWIAQRNTLVAGTFGLATLYLHDRARREGRPLFDAAAALLLGVSLFSAEVALAVVPYLIAYAWFLDDKKWRSLLPFVPPLLVWVVTYKLGHYGAHGSDLYVDPAQRPVLYIENILTHWPMLVAIELGFIAVDFYVLLPFAGKALVVLVSALLAGGLIAAVRPLFARSATTRFLLVGSLVSLVPACAVFPGGRVLFLPSFGLIAVLAELLSARIRGEVVRRWFQVPIVFATVGFHLLLAPVLFVAATAQMKILESALGSISGDLPNVPELESQRVVVVNPPDATFLGYVSAIRADRGLSAPAKMLAMAAGVRPLAIERTSATSLTLSSPVALVQPGTDLLIREERPFEVGDRVELSDVTIEVTRVNDGGWPTEARFDFAEPLESPTLRFVAWRDKRFVPLALPNIGERIEFPAQRLELF